MLRRAAAYLSQARLPGKDFSRLVQSAAFGGYSCDANVKGCGRLCWAQYYRWLAQPVTVSERIRTQRLEALREAHLDDPQAGYRYLHDEVEAAGVVMCERTAWSICSQHQLWYCYGIKRGRNAKPLGLLSMVTCFHVDARGRTCHDFTAAASRTNQVWVTDITEHPAKEGKLYFCAVKDVYSNRIIGYTAAPHMNSALAVSALNTAVARRQRDGHDVTGCIVHSDRGSQFRSGKYRQPLGRHGLVGSMGRVASASDNVAMESFFFLLQHRRAQH